MSYKTSIWFITLQYTIKRYSQCNCSAQAAALTVDTLLSLVPLLATSIALLATIPSLQHLVIDAEQKLLTHFIANTGQDIQTYLQQLTKQAATVSVIGALILLATTIKVLYTLNQAFQVMLNVRIRQKTTREIIFSCLAWVFAPVLVGIGIGIGIAISSYIVSTPLFKAHSEALILLKSLVFLIPIVLNTMAFCFLYMVSPLFVVPIRNVIYGAFCASLLFELSKWLFGLYIIYFPSYQALYGSLAAIPLFIIWINASWQIALFGALIAQSLAYKDRYRSKIKLDGFRHAICWLGHLWQAKIDNRQLTLPEIIEKDKVSYQVEPELMLDKLRELDLIAVTAKGQYTLAKNIEKISLFEYFRSLPWKPASKEQLQQLEFSWKNKLIPIMESLVNSEKEQLNKPFINIFDS